jgi:hypothetical protein
MKQIATLHKNQIRQQVIPTSANRSLSPLGMTAEEQKEWDAAFTPEEFIKKVCRSLKERFDEHDRKV